jgi:hypothetical protein
MSVQAPQLVVAVLVEAQHLVEVDLVVQVLIEFVLKVLMLNDGAFPGLIHCSCIQLLGCMWPKRSLE